MTRARLAAALLLGAVALFAFAVVAQLDRPPAYDEAEFLHGAIRIARGERIYIDFAEHHPPFVFAILSKLNGPSPALRAAVVRGRLLFGFFGLIAAGLICFLTWRATHRAEAVAIVLGLLMSGPEVWARAFADIRGEPLGLALWFSGAALVLLAPHSAWRGVGIGLVALACLINPKWPLESVVIAVVFAARMLRNGRGRLIGVVAAALTTMAAVATVALMTTFDRFAYHVVQLNMALVRWAVDVRTTAPPVRLFFQCSSLLHPAVIIPAAGVVGWSALRKESPFRDRLIAVTAMALMVASLAEIRFLYPYPRMWQQYYVFWSIAAAVVLGMAPLAVEDALRRADLVAARWIAPVFALIALIAATAVVPPGRAPYPYWLNDTRMRSKLDGAGTQWLDLFTKPIGTGDASYYWFGFADFVPASLRAAKSAEGARYLPRMTEDDLPPCRLERGLEPTLRLISDPTNDLPAARQCFERLRAQGVLVPTGLRSVWEVRSSRYNSPP